MHFPHRDTFVDGQRSEHALRRILNIVVLVQQLHQSFLVLSLRVVVVVLLPSLSALDFRSSVVLRLFPAVVHFASPLERTKVNKLCSLFETSLSYPSRYRSVKRALTHTHRDTRDSVKNEEDCLANQVFSFDESAAGKLLIFTRKKESKVSKLCVRVGSAALPLRCASVWGPKRAGRVLLRRIKNGARPRDQVEEAEDSQILP